jgi:hypothetical protein
MSTSNWETYGGVRFSNDEGHHDVEQHTGDDYTGNCSYEYGGSRFSSEEKDPMAYINKRLRELREAREAKEALSV